MNQIATDRAQKIQAHHDAAHAAADTAIEHAKEAGRLLLEVKASLPHGDFSKWVSQHLTVSHRQAQRYMAAAEGKTPKLPGKSDTMSYLVDESPKTLHDYFRPSWIPMKGYTYSCATDTGAYWVVHSKEHPGFFHVSHLTEETYGGTRRPVAGIAVEYMLQGYDLVAPADADWEIRKGYDMSRPFGEPEELFAEWTAQRFALNVPFTH